MSTRAQIRVRVEMAQSLKPPKPKDWESLVERWLEMLGPKKKRRTRDPRTRERRATTKELDRLCREIVFKRDEGKCRKCGKPAQDWSHCYSRRYKWLRWNLANSWASCKGCHLEWHHRPLEGAKWWEKELGKAKYRALVLLAGKPLKVDTAKVKAELEGGGDG